MNETQWIHVNIFSNSLLYISVAYFYLQTNYNLEKP